MATYEDIAPIELRRLAELEKQQALHGPMTEPSILIEIAELRHKYGSRRVSVGRNRDEFEYSFLMSTVAAALRRVTAIEARLDRDDADRPARQKVLNIWLGAISALVVLNVAVLLMEMWR